MDKLLTGVGEQSLYDAVSQCSRCGYCEQACPTYVATGREPISARGRNQVVRMLLEGKFVDPREAEESLSTCLLCSACTTVCPAHIPTADIVLEGRRRIRGGPHWLARRLTGLLADSPERFRALLRRSFRLKRWGLARLAARLGLLRLLGLRGVEEAVLHVDEAPRRFLGELLAEDPELKDARGAAWLYFAPCGPNYVLPRVGLATVRVLKAARGRGAALGGGCCGLLAYNYGDVEDARRLARAFIERVESRGAPEDAPVAGDCSSCVSFLKSYPQLFLDEPDWRARAERLAARARDVVEAVPAEAARALKGEGVVTYHDSCRARHGQGLAAEPRAALRRSAGERYRELPEADVCCGGAGTFAFAHPDLSETLLKSKAAAVASTQARTVAVSSTSCLLQLARGLKKYYPDCRAVHFSELIAESLEGPDGKTTGA